MFLIDHQTYADVPAPVFTPHPADRPAKTETTEPQT